MSQRSSSTSVLEIDQLNFSRGDRHVLKDLSWSIHEGQHWVILGANGCGKSTLIHCLTGYKMATSGSIRIGAAQYGQSDWREVRKSVGLVTSHLTTYLEPHETALSIVCSGRDAVLNQVAEVTPEVEREGRALLEEFGCAKLLGSRWSYLSQGEKQKVLICRALMAHYRVLILDEPCAGLDPVARAQFLAWLETLLKRPDAPSVVLVTHHVEEVIEPFTHLLLLKEGQVLGSGEKDLWMTQAALCEVYGADLVLTKKAQRYELNLVGMD